MILQKKLNFIMKRILLIFHKIKENMKMKQNKVIALKIITIFIFFVFIYIKKSVIINIIVTLILSFLLYFSIMVNWINKKNESALINHSVENSNFNKMDRLLKKYFEERKKLKEDIFYEQEETIFIKKKDKNKIQSISRISKLRENKNKIRNDTFSFRVGSSYIRKREKILTIAKKKIKKKNILNLGPLFKSSKNLKKEEKKIDLKIFKSPKKKKKKIFQGFPKKKKD